MEIILPPEIEAGLVEQARQLGISPQQLALASLRRQFAPATQAPQDQGTYQSLADFLGDLIGAVDSSEFGAGGARMSEATADDFAKGLLEKRRQGHL